MLSQAIAYRIASGPSLAPVEVSVGQVLGNPSGSFFLVGLVLVFGLLSLLFAVLWLKERRGIEERDAAVASETDAAGTTGDSAPQDGDPSAPSRTASSRAAEPAPRPQRSATGQEEDPLTGSIAVARKPAPSGDEEDLESQLRGREILVIDDDVGSRAVLRWMLGEEGYKVHETESGDGALELLAKRRVDLVILDIQMPGLSGFDVCRSIRRRHALDELPILYVTGKESLESLLAGFEAGGNDYLVKPLRRGELIARVKIHLATTLSAIGYRRRLRQAVRVSQEERELRRQLFEVRERERRHLAQELHDGPIQDLHALVLALRRGPDSLEKPVENLHEVMSELRTLCTELRPPALMFGGLAGSLKVHVGRLQERYPDVELRSMTMDDGDQLSEWNRLQLFRIAQEALSNALQHAAPSEVELGFELDAEGCRLWVRDDGAGFAVPERWIELARDEHFGLVGMSERAESMDGKMTLHSVPGRGTELTVEVPWPDGDGDGDEDDGDGDGDGEGDGDGVDDNEAGGSNRAVEQDPPQGD